MRKILRFLLERFFSKLTTIKENKDLDIIKVEELVGSLQIYSTLQTRKGKSTTLKTVKEDQENFFNEKNMNDENLELIVRKFRKFLFNKKPNRKQK